MWRINQLQCVSKKDSYNNDDGKYIFDTDNTDEENIFVMIPMTLTNE